MSGTALLNPANATPGDAWQQALERVVDGMVHDFNNQITGIHALSEALRSQTDMAPAVQEAFDQIQASAMKAREIVQRIVDLQRAKVGTKAYHNLNELVTRTLDLLRKALSRSVQVDTALTPQQLPVYVDAVAFSRALVQLAFCFVGGLPKGSKIRFETAHHAPCPPEINLPGKSTTAGVCLTVRAVVLQPSAPLLTGEQLQRPLREFVDENGGDIQVATNETAVSLWLPEADFTEAPH